MTGRTPGPLSALPAYLGGKRRLRPAIFDALSEMLPRSSWPGLAFLDPFMGGGSVSLHAKMQGFIVHCSDIAMRSQIVGEALIANGEKRLTRRDLLPLFEYPADARVRGIAREFLTDRQADFLAGALPGALAARGPTRWLLLLVLVKWVLQALPMSSPASTDARRAAALDLDAVSSNRVGSYLRGQASVRPSVLWRIAVRVNAGVLPGTGTASRMDAVQFLRDRSGDIVFMDPPYPATTAYEDEYALLDRILEGERLPRSAYSSTTPPLEELLDAAAHVPVWLITFGGRDPERLVDLVRTRRERVVVHRVPYTHLASLAPGRKVHEHVICAA